MTNVRFSGVQEGVYVRKFRVTQHLDTVSEGGSARDWTWQVTPGRCYLPCPALPLRTKGDGGASRTVASKAPRKALGGGGSSSSAASRAISAAAGAGSGRSGGFCAVS